MIRQIIKIDEEKCTGCGLCANACHEGAIGMVDGKAKLLRDDYCDGMGDCLPACPADAIHFEKREAAAYDEAAVMANKAAKEAAKMQEAKKAEMSQPEKKPFHGCPGSQSRQIVREAAPQSDYQEAVSAAPVNRSQLSQWPVQIKLAPTNAPYFNGANLLIAADCTAYAYGDFHNRFIRNRVTLIGCPKLDEGDYSEKLTAIIRDNNIRSVTVVRMQVPCCRGIENAVKKALMQSGKFIPWQVVVISTDGRIIEE